ncbi:MAG: hypothetical protein HY078_17695 [Elusimicrobia bacterium]|nr:hypothetical protein [Elusimicrobiota bacterium]
MSTGLSARAAVPFGDRLDFILQGLWAFIRVQFVPLDLRIEYFALPPESLAEGLARAAASFAVVAAWLWAIARWRRKTPVLALLLLWPLAFLVLTSNAIPVKVLNMRLTAERWMYLPFIGAAGAAAYFLHKRPRLALGILLALAAGTWARARDWSDETRLWSSLLAIYPWCAKAEEGLGEAYSRQDRYPEALAAYERARELREARKDKVLRRYAELSAEGLVRWESPTLHRGLGRTYLKLDRVADADREFLKASALEPKDGYTYGVMAYRYAEAGDFKKAAEWTKRGLAAIPDDEFLRRIEPDVRKGRLTFRAGFH